MTADKGLVFYESSHRYRLDGEWVPGVTTILNVLNKPALPRWAATMVAEYVAGHREAVEHLYEAGHKPMVDMLKAVPWQSMDDAGTRGTKLHDYAEQIAKGETADVPDDLLPVVENAVRFMDDWSIEPILIEEAVASRMWRYAGKLDLVARYIHPLTQEPGVAIWDWKSGKKIYPEACFQMNAYGFAEFYGQRGDEHPMDELGISAAFGVHIRPDDYSVHPLPYGPDVFGEFLTILQTFDLKKRADGDWRIPGSGYVGEEVGS